MPSRKYLFFVFLLQGVGKFSIHVLCMCLFQVSTTSESNFVLSDFSKPLWDIISHMVSHVTLPTPGKNRVLFAIENCLLSAEAPPKEWLPHADVCFLFWFVLTVFSLVSSIIPMLNWIHSFYSHQTGYIKLFCACRYRSSHWCSVWMLINWYCSLLLSCLKEGYCFDQISIWSFCPHFPLSNFDHFAPSYQFILI